MLGGLADRLDRIDEATEITAGCKGFRRQRWGLDDETIVMAFGSGWRRALRLMTRLCPVW